MIRGGAAVVLTVIAVGGCAPPAARTTFLRQVDLVDMTDRMAASFAADPVIGRRGPDDPPWVISIDRVVNHTNQIIPGREKWLYVVRLRALLAEAGLSRRRSLVWVIPPERWAALAGEAAAGVPGPRLPPTHVLAAEFHSLTSTGGGGRADTYFCGFQLTDLGSGRLVWEDAWEVKRAVEGLTYD